MEMLFSLYCMLGLIFGAYFILNILPDDVEKINWFPTFITFFLCGPLFWFVLLICFIFIIIVYFFLTLNVKEKIASFYTKN